MKPFFGRLAALAIPAALVVLGFPGCADSQSMIFIRQVQAPTREGKSCTVSNLPSDTHYESGVLDTVFKTQYSAALVVGSQLVPRGNASSLRTETSRIALQGSIVRLADATGAVVWGPVTVPGAGFIDPANDSVPSYGTISTIMVGADYGLKLKAELKAAPGFIRNFTATVRVFGQTLGGTDVESGDFTFPVRACYGCLIDSPADSNVATVPGKFSCGGSAISLVSPCTLGQDEAVDCRICKAALHDTDDLDACGP